MDLKQRGAFPRKTHINPGGVGRCRLGAALAGSKRRVAGGILKTSRPLSVTTVVEENHCSNVPAHVSEEKMAWNKVKGKRIT